VVGVATSTKTGMAPTARMGIAVMAGAVATTMTSLPAVTPRASSARCSAAVPEEQATAWWPALNLIRPDAWWHGETLDPRRTSHLSPLECTPEQVILPW
jgi:hypothetical protein